MFKNNGISHDFFCPVTPQQNGVIVHKNRTLQEMSRTIINENNMEKYFWDEVVNIACYIQIRISIRPIMEKTLSERWKNKIPTFNISIHLDVLVICLTLKIN